MPPVKYPHIQMPITTKEMVLWTNKTTQEQERGSSNEIDRNNWSYADKLWGTNNINDAQDVNKTHDVCGDTCVFVEID